MKEISTLENVLILINIIPKFFVFIVWLLFNKKSKVSITYLKILFFNTMVLAVMSIGSSIWLHLIKSEEVGPPIFELLMALYVFILHKDLEARKKKQNTTTK